MAAPRAKTLPTGSTQWIQSERDQAGQFVQQEAEEFSYSVRNELEWLNEHMAEIFSKEQLNFADVFKTPGKLRGKTPHTARKRDALATRQPLTDIFAPNQQMGPPSTKKNAFYERVAHFQIAEDEKSPAQDVPVSRGKSPQRVVKTFNTDSGYHGMTEDEYDTDVRTQTNTQESQWSQTQANTQESQWSQVQKVPLRDDQLPVQRKDGTALRASDETFMSAKEEMSSRSESRDGVQEKEDNSNVAVPDDEMEVDENAKHHAALSAQASISQEHDDMDDEVSDASSPEKPLQRKSSFTFASLPAREPLTAKKSIGVRDSNVDALNGRNSYLARSYGTKAISTSQKDDDEEQSQQKPEDVKTQIKTSAQLLHERINMLNKPKELRTSKSVPVNILGNQVSYPQLPSVDSAGPSAKYDVAADEDEDDWIAPTKSKAAQLTPAKPPMHQKSISTTNIPSATKRALPGALGHLKANSVSDLQFAARPSSMAESTTPVGSPLAKRFNDGPLSASKNRLWSALKSAKSIFASSASISAAAKLEAHTQVNASPLRERSGTSADMDMVDMPGALHSDSQPPQEMTRPEPDLSASPKRKTRASTESDKKRDKELRAQQKAADDLEKAREKERKKAAKQQEEIVKREQAEVAKKEKEQRQAERPTMTENTGSRDGEMGPFTKSLHAPGKLRTAPGRLMRPTRAEPTTSKPAPVSIRVASQSQRLGQPPTQSSFSKSQHGDMGPPPPPKSALRPSSAQSSSRGSVAPNSARVKALEAAARKKEADEKAAQKKMEQKRELEKKRAAKAEEERRAEEERKAAEQQRRQEAALAAQKKTEQAAAEAKRREQQRTEQLRQQEEAQRARAAHELAEAIKRERAQQAPSYPRGDVGGTLRQLTKPTADLAARNASIQTNPAKPVKRPLQQEEDDQQQQAPQRPGLMRGPPSYQQNNTKRRKTDEEDEREEKHSVMAPPKRPSNMRKESVVSKFSHGYQHAPAPASHHQSSMFKATVTAQHQLQHPGSKPMHPSQTVQMSNARIPFAEHSNAPSSQHSAYSQQYSNDNASSAHQNKYKTPARPGPAQGPLKSAKSSPLYQNGDAIQLPEIQTDSEEEDSDDEDSRGGLRVPSWVASPALRDLLTQQQTIDPESVFGPIGELKMDEVFKNGKNADRLKRFRDRGSSAAWIESGDAVTSAEKRKDMEGRERVAREGGWRFQPLF
ncbi:Hypothetical protein R9X50_00277900 [Acrodontium crateriforme]|uniref:Inner centromere protein ARK-binding domain-containing protein n=1 Tax=Acrodontium crateriforme TaxID=150365 RepID=A0AAQ3M7R2_9PEZI|nr:Hypothetical protein R9X50_00277900 [Acrodontium crateriforme]